MITRTVTYGTGGYDPDAPDENIISVEEVEVSDPDPAPDTADITAVIDAMTPAQLDAVRSLLGLT